MSLLSRREFIQLSSALALALEHRANAAGFTLVRMPYLQSVLTTKASILWTTLEAGNGTATITGGSTSRTVAASRRLFSTTSTRLTFPFYQYQADFTDLSPDTAYSYSIGVNGQTLAGGPGLLSFRTANTSTKFSFLAMGDSGQDTPEQLALVKLMLAEKDIRFFLHNGDLSYPQGDYVNYEDSYFGKNAALMSQLCFYVASGNHDYVYGEVPFMSVHSFPKSAVPVPAVHQGLYYSFDWGHIHFSTIDSNRLNIPGESDQMLSWLDQDLNATDKYWRIIMLHHTPYPTGHHLGDDICNLAHDRVNPIAERNGVQFVIAGHEHGYERTVSLISDTAVSGGRGITYLTTGGGGAYLHDVGIQPQTAVALSTFHYTRIDVDGATLSLRAIGTDGAEIDHFSLTPSAVLTQVVSAADYSANVSNGALISIFGRNLAVESAAFSSVPLPLSLNSVGVTIGGQAAPLLYVSPNQINCQVPSGLSGTQQVQVTTSHGTVSTQVSVDSVAPAIVTVTYRDQAVSATNPAPPGSTLVVYATGLGKTTTDVPVGQASSGLNTVIAPVDVILGRTVHINPLYAGLTAGLVGVYQVNVTIPSSTPTGNSVLQIATAGVTSRVFNLVVGQNKS